MSEFLTPPKIETRANDSDLQHYSNTMNEMAIEMSRGLVDRLDQARQIVEGVAARQDTVLIGAPGISKTKLVTNMAKTIRKDQRPNSTRVLGRFQGTEDKLPSEALGSEVWNPQTGEFTFRKGPIFSNIFFADEINRASTKTQSAINEAAEERQVTIGNQTLYLPETFIILASENEHEHGQATNPMSDSLVDRFGESVFFPDPSLKDRVTVGSQFASKEHKVAPREVVSIDEIAKLMEYVEERFVSEQAIDYAGRVIEAVIAVEGVELVSVGYRSMQSAVRMAQANSVLKNNPLADVENMKAIMPNVLVHRVKSVNDETSLAEKRAVVETVLKNVPEKA
jgi:MoxR-like ATPase